MLFTNVVLLMHTCIFALTLFKWFEFITAATSISNKSTHEITEILSLLDDNEKDYDNKILHHSPSIGRFMAQTLQYLDGASIPLAESIKRQGYYYHYINYSSFDVVSYSDQQYLLQYYNQVDFQNTNYFISYDDNNARLIKEKELVNYLRLLLDNQMSNKLIEILTSYNNSATIHSKSDLPNLFNKHKFYFLLSEGYLSQNQLELGINVIIKAIKQFTYRYEFWNRYVDIITFYIYKMLIKAEEVTSRNLDQNNYFDIVHLFEKNRLHLIHGLELFPRCPGLLLLQSLSYYYQINNIITNISSINNNTTLVNGNIICSQHIYKRSLQVRKLATKTFNESNAIEYLLYYHDYLIKSSHNYNHTWADYNCFPFQYITKPTVENKCGKIYKEFHNNSNSNDDNNNNNQRKKCKKSSYHSIQVGCNEWNKCVKKKWKIIDAMESISTHILTNSFNLSTIEDESVGKLYSSHTLEHLSHYAPFDQPGASSEVCKTLDEWNRVLIPNGKLYLSVPNLELLARMLLDKSLQVYQRKLAMVLIYGGQDYEYNFHKTGFIPEHLVELLSNSNFCDIQFVNDFKLFNDTSILKALGKYVISINIIAKKCKQRDPNAFCWR
eukprot:gene11504-15410_t